MLPISKVFCQLAVVLGCFFSVSANAVDSDFDTLPDEWERANNRNPEVADYMISTRPFLDNISRTHVCSIDDVGVKCWGGDNGYGQLNVPSELSNPISIAVGASHSCAIDDSGVVCWGRNDYGQIDVPEGIEGPRLLSLGRRHSCVIDQVGVKCWGGNSYTGVSSVPATISNPTVISANHYATCAIDDNGATCWGRGFQGNIDLPDGLVNPKDISIGITHGCALDDNGVQCWGDSLFGKTDVPDDLVNPIMVAVGSYNSCAIDDNGLQCWGYQSYGVNDIPQGLSEVTDVAISHKHACALSLAGVTCWGKPDNGQNIVPELSFDPDNDGVDSSVDELPLDPTESVDTDKDGIGDNKDLVNDLFDARLFQVNSLSFSGTITNGILSARSRVSLTVRNTSNRTVKINSLDFNASTLVTDTGLLGGDGQLSPNESFGIQVTIRNSQSFPFNWTVNFVNPNTSVNQEFSVRMNLNSDYKNGIAQISASGSTSRYFNLLKDSDNDRVFDINDAFPRDPTESKDTDNDGLGDNFEIANGLDINNADSDNDGVLDNTDVFPLDDGKSTLLDDDIAPIVTAPNDIYVDATGAFTSMNLGKAIVTDNLELLTAQVDDEGPFASGEITLNWSATDTAGNQGTAQQYLFIRPYLQVSPLARVIKQNSLSIPIRLSGDAISYPVIVPVSVDAEGVRLNNGQVEINEGSFTTLEIELSESLVETSFNLEFATPSNAFLNENNIMQITFLDNNVIQPYELFVQPTPQFASLSPTAKIIVTSAQGENFFDVAKYISNATTDNPVSVVGETFLISGSSEIDGFMVQPGVKYDLTNLKGGIDKLYFSGPQAEYADSILLDSATGVMQLSRLTDLGEEIVQFIATASAADKLIFTDGALSTADVKAAVSAQTPLTDLTLDTSIKALDDKTVTGATIKHIVLNSDGGSVMGLGPSIKTLISGNSGIDQIYVPAGSIVDASNLKSGRDEITLEGGLADYDISLDASGNIVLSRDVVIDDVTHTESVTVANGGNVATNDLVIFADQQLDISTIKQQL